MLAGVVLPKAPLLGLQTVTLLLLCPHMTIPLHVQLWYFFLFLQGYQDYAPPSQIQFNFTTSLKGLYLQIQFHCEVLRVRTSNI